jgi:hypothetical protein
MDFARVVILHLKELMFLIPKWQRGAAQNVPIEEMA